jgi:hypothetical protein
MELMNQIAEIDGGDRPAARPQCGRRDDLALSPSASTVNLPKHGSNLDTLTRRNRFRLLDVADDLDFTQGFSMTASVLARPAQKRESRGPMSERPQVRTRRRRPEGTCVDVSQAMSE